MSDCPTNLTLSVAITEHEAWCFAQFLKRVGFNEIRISAVDKDEAYVMIDAIERVREALAQAGYAPR